MKVCDKWDHSWIERCWRIVAKDKRCVLWEKAVFADCLNTEIALRNGFEELSEIKDDDALEFSSADEADISFSNHDDDDWNPFQGLFDDLIFQISMRRRNVCFKSRMCRYQRRSKSDDFEDVLDDHMVLLNKDQKYQKENLFPKRMNRERGD